MKRFRTILATTDLSPESFSAVAYAAQLAKADASRLVVLHVPQALSLVYTHFSPPVDMMNLDEQIHAAAEDALVAWAGRHLRRVEKKTLRVVEGVAHEVITEVAEEVGADLIVMASHGRRGLERFVLGSVAEKVLRKAPCPVLVTRPEPDSGSAAKTTKKKAKKKAAKKKAAKKKAASKR